MDLKLKFCTFMLVTGRIVYLVFKLKFCIFIVIKLSKFYFVICLLFFVGLDFEIYLIFYLLWICSALLIVYEILFTKKLGGRITGQLL
jgi:hypothetical protein